jgi:hypothetical protein
MQCAVGSQQGNAGLQWVPSSITEELPPAATQRPSTHGPAAWQPAPWQLPLQQPPSAVQAAPSAARAGTHRPAAHWPLQQSPPPEQAAPSRQVADRRLAAGGAGVDAARESHGHGRGGDAAWNLC